MSYADLPKTWLGETMLRLLECSRQALADDGREPGLVHLVPGIEPAWDNCCKDGGQLYVRVLSLVPVLPTNVATSSNCGPIYLRATIGLGILRCTPTVSGKGTPPSAENLTGSALEMARDAHTLQKAAQCCLKEAPGVRSPASILSWNPLGAEGGCAGGEWQLTVGIPSCGDCD